MKYPFSGSGDSLGLSIVEKKGDIHLITAGCMLAALDYAVLGLHTPEACVISWASFDVRDPNSQNFSSHAISTRLCSAMLTGYTITDTVGNLVNTDVQQRFTPSSSVANSEWEVYEMELYPCTHHRLLHHPDISPL